MKRKVIDLDILENLAESGVSALSLVDRPAIEIQWMAFKDQKFVEPNAGESEDEFLNRCIPVLLDEGKDQDQAVAVCYSMYEQKFAEYPWEDCIADQTKRGLNQESAERLCGWIKANMSYDVSALPPYVDEVTEDKKKKLEVEVEMQEELDIYGYRTRYFYICPGAYATFQHFIDADLDEDAIGMVRAAAVIADRVFQIEKEVLEAKETTPEQMKEALVLIEDFYDIIEELDEIMGMVHDVSYMDNHAEVIASYFNPEVNAALAAVEDLKVGDAVSWKTADQNPRGRIREIIRNGGKTVPGTSFVLQGSEEDPGYIIEIYEKTNGKWEPTGKFAGRKADSILKNVELWRQVFASQDEQIIVGPALIPDIKIYRKDDDKTPAYEVRFSREAIAKIAEKFMKELRGKSTNIQHDESKPGETYVMESWIVENAEDKANTIYGLDVPVGTWVVKGRVTDPKIWQMVKEGKLTGWSVEGSFLDAAEVKELTEDKNLYSKIVKILNEK